MNECIHLLIEKPVASNIEDGKEILKVANEKNLKVIIVHIERYNPVV